MDTDQLSPNILHTQLTAYQSTVRTLHEQNDHNAELLGCLEAVVIEKDVEISRLRIKETEKELRLQAQHRDFQAQLAAEQTAREQVSNTLEALSQELENLKAQSGHNPMEVSLSENNIDINQEHEKAEEEKRKLQEALEKAKIEYKQALASKNRDVTVEIERMKKHIWKNKCERKEQKPQKPANITYNLSCWSYVL